MGRVTVESDTEWPNGRRVVAFVASSSRWRQDRYGSYVVDLWGGSWFCTCWKPQPCTHSTMVARQVRV